ALFGFVACVFWLAVWADALSPIAKLSASGVMLANSFLIDDLLAVKSDSLPSTTSPKRVARSNVCKFYSVSEIVREASRAAFRLFFMHLLDEGERPLVLREGIWR